MKIALMSIVMVLLLTTEWKTDFEKAKEQAAAEKKLILLNFSGSDWCGPCIRLKKEVFESQGFSDVADSRLILVRADFPRQKKNKLPEDQTRHNERLAEQYNANGKFPLTLLLSSDGRVLKEWDGYAFGTQDKFIEDLRTSIDKNSPR
jgi:thioredoxin-related protein